MNYKLNPVSSSCCSQGEADLNIAITSGGVIPAQDIWTMPFGKGSSNVSQNVSGLVTSHYLSGNRASQVGLGGALSGPYTHPLGTAFPFKCTLCQLPPSRLLYQKHQI